MYDTGIAFVLGQVAAAVEAESNPRDRLVAGLRTFLTVLADEPAFCRAIVLEVWAAGPTGVAKRRAVLQVFAGRYLEVNRQARELDRRVGPLAGDVALGVVGAILELVSERVEEGRTEELPGLSAPLSEFVIRNILPTAA
jgi:hypothetical protein